LLATIYGEIKYIY